MPAAGVEPPITELSIVPAFISAVVATSEAAVVIPSFETVSLSVPSLISTLNKSTV